MLEVTYWEPTDTVDSHNPMKYVNEKFIKVTLNGTVEDKIKLDSVQLTIRQLIHQKDTTLGIEFTFTNNAKYSSVVRLFNLCKIEGARTYLNHENKLWVFNVSFSPTSLPNTPNPNSYIEL